MKNIIYRTTNKIPKRYVFILITFGMIMVSCIKEQVSPGLKDSFTKLMGGIGSEGYGIKVAQDGYVVMGNIKIDGKSNVYLAGLSETGKIIWNKSYGGPDDEYGNRMEVMSDGSLLVVGKSENSSGSKVFLFKIMSGTKGDTAWMKYIDIGDNSKLTGYSVKEIQGGDIMVVGSSTVSSVKTECLAMLLNSNGNVMLNNVVSYGTTAAINDVVEYKDRYIITGYSVGYFEQGAERVLIDNLTTTNLYQNNPDTLMGSSGSNKGVRLLKTGENSFVALSTVYSGEATKKDIMVTWFYFKYNFDGIVITNQKTYSTKDNSGANASYDDEAADITANETGFMITGTCAITENNTDIIFLAIDKDGNETSMKTIGGGGNQRGNSIEASPDGGCVIVGGTGSSSNSKIVAYKLDKNGNY